ncbi:MAG: rane protein [Bacteroidota bacterium]|jgi:predicted PurR-regulated permease PerM|nr:rane protein [Bacteroidota bacterium]
MVQKTSLVVINRLLFFVVLSCAVLYFGKPILVPVTFSVFFAMLFTPLSNKLERFGIKRIFTSLLSLIIIVAIALGIGCLVFVEAKRLAEDFPAMEKKAELFMNKSQDYISAKLNVPEKKQDALINKQLRSFLESSGSFFKDFLAGSVEIFASAVMVLIFTFLFLYQREKYETFFVRLMKDTPEKDAKKLIDNISTVAQSYLTGRVLSVIIFTILFSIGFLIIGLKSAFLLAFIAALLTIIPYVGSIIGGLFPFAVALVTSDSSNVAFGALAVVVIIQSIDNYFIEPYIIGGEVNISGFFTILILLAGGIIWGVAGMILFLPMLGVTKIIFDAVPELRVYGYLIGDQKKGKQSERLWKKVKGMFKKGK